MGKAHRATGNPRGRPPKLPFDFGKRIMDNLRRRVNPKTGLVRPLTAHMARELDVSRSTVSRELRSLRQLGAFEIVYERVSPKQLVIYYRLKGLKTSGKRGTDPCDTVGVIRSW